MISTIDYSRTRVISSTALAPRAPALSADALHTAIMNLLIRPFNSCACSLGELVKLLATQSPSIIASIPEIVIKKPNAHDHLVVKLMCMQFPALKIRTTQRETMENMYKIMDEIIKRGLEKEGIFRLTFDLEGAQSMMHKVIDGEQIVEIASTEPHDLAIVVKGFTRNAFPNLIQTSDLETFKAKGISSVASYLANLSSTRRFYLAKLAALCRNIAENESKNKMNIHNLARIMAPNMFQDRDPMKEIAFINTTISFVEEILKQA